MILNAINPEHALRWTVIDAATGLQPIKEFMTRFADEERNVLGVVPMAAFLNGDFTVIERHVPRVVIDFNRRTIFFNVGEPVVAQVEREVATA